MKNNKQQVTVLGGSGYIGSHLSDLLTQKGFTNLYGVDWLDFKNIKYSNSLSHYQKVDLNAQNWNQNLLL